MKRWAEGARSILDFMKSEGGSTLQGKSWQLVKYEDLLERPTANYYRILGTSRD